MVCGFMSRWRTRDILRERLTRKNLQSLISNIIPVLRAIKFLEGDL